MIMGYVCHLISTFRVNDLKGNEMKKIKKKKNLQSIIIILTAEKTGYSVYIRSCILKCQIIYTLISYDTYKLQRTRASQTN